MKVTADAEEAAHTMLRAVLASSLWFTFNISMSTVMKWTYLYGRVCKFDGTDCRVYNFPFMMTAIHMLYSWVVCCYLIRMRSGPRATLSLVQQFGKIVPLALCFSLSVVCGNLSLKYIYPSFSQMLSSMTPLITVIIAVLLRGKRYNCWTWASMPVICGGLLVCGTAEVNFHLYGAIFAVVSTVLRALKSVMQEKMLDPKEKDMDAVTLLYHMAPYAGLFLVSMSIAFEGPDPIMMLFPWRDGVPTVGTTQVLMLLSLSGINACFLNIANNLVTAYLGAVMLQILGNLKSCISIVVSVAVFGNPVTPLQSGGVVMCLMGVWLYNHKGGLAEPKPIADSQPTQAKVP